MTRLASKKHSSGKIMIEFLLAAPVLLSISGGTIEVANFMRLTQIATVASQEAANQAYRQCSSVTRLVNPAQSSYNISQRTAAQIDHNATHTAVVACLDSVRRRTMSTLSRLNGNTAGNAVHLTVARYNPKESEEANKYEEFDSFSTTSAPASAAYGGPGSGAYDGSHEDTGNAHNRRSGRLAGATLPSAAFLQQLRLDDKKVKYTLITGQEVDLIVDLDLQRREQVIVGQAVAGYTPIVRFFNLAVLYSGEFRATTVL